MSVLNAFTNKKARTNRPGLFALWLSLIAYQKAIQRPEIATESQRNMLIMLTKRMLNGGVCTAPIPIQEITPAI